jgi:hypothetical protein
MSNSQLSEEQIDDIEEVIDTDEEVEKMVEMMEIDDEVDVIVDDKNPRDYSLTDHLSATGNNIRRLFSLFKSHRVYPSHAVVDDIDYEDENLKVYFQTIGYNKEFTENYYLPSERTDDVDEETVAFFSTAGAQVYEPSSLTGKEVPVNYDGEYTVDLPPENPGVLNAFRYKKRRVGRNLNLFKVKNGRNTLNMNGISVMSVLMILCVAGMIIVQSLFSSNIVQVLYSIVFVVFSIIYLPIAAKNY